MKVVKVIGMYLNGEINRMFVQCFRKVLVTLKIL